MRKTQSDMKINELMIGDFVTFKDYQEDKAPFGIEIIALGYQGRGEENEALVCIDGAKASDIIEIDDEIVGIPLTPEILEKNGFEDISNHTLKGYDTFRLDIEQRGFDYCVTIKLKDYFKLQSYDDRWYTLCEMEFGCNYVHQLQHVLRLCGIEKDLVI